MVIAVDEMSTAILNYEPIRRLSADMRRAAALLAPHEVRYLVDRYYQIQEDRKRGANQLRAASVDHEPNLFLSWLAGQVESFEGVCKSALTIVAKSTVPGRWLLSIVGIGPVLTAGLLAHLDITRAPHPSSFWRFVGLDPSKQWLGAEKAQALVTRLAGSVPGKGRRAVDMAALLDHVCADIRSTPEQVLHIVAWQKRPAPSAPLPTLDDVLDSLTRAELVRAVAARPWNAKAKVLLWKIGDSFVKVSNHPKDTMYGTLYKARKTQEWQRNLAGAFVSQAQAAQARTLTANQAQWYMGAFAPAEIQPQLAAGVTPSQWTLTPVPGAGVPMLPPGRIELRARHYAVKLFLSHLHHVMHVCHYGKPPDAPYILAHDPRHTHYTPPPNWPLGDEAVEG